MIDTVKSGGGEMTVLELCEIVCEEFTLPNKIVPADMTYALRTFKLFVDKGVFSV